MRWFLVLALLVACTPHGEAAATAACSKFVEFGADAEIRTNADKAEHAQEIYDLARASDDESLSDATRRLLAGVVQDDESLYAGGFNDTYDACGL